LRLGCVRDAHTPQAPATRTPLPRTTRTWIVRDERAAGLRGNTARLLNRPQPVLRAVRRCRSLQPPQPRTLILKPALRPPSAARASQGAGTRTRSAPGRARPPDPAVAGTGRRGQTGTACGRG